MKRIFKIAGIVGVMGALSGCYVGETAALIVQTPFEVADVVIPGDAVSSVGEGAGWVTDAVIPF